MWVATILVKIALFVDFSTESHLLSAELSVVVVAADT